MKGPFERLKYDMRRLWECPQCKKRERTEGTVTSRLCLCEVKNPGGQPAVMKLLEEAGHRTVPPIVPVISVDPEPTVPTAFGEGISPPEAAMIDLPPASDESLG